MPKGMEMNLLRPATKQYTPQHLLVYLRRNNCQTQTNTETFPSANTGSLRILTHEGNWYQEECTRTFLFMTMAFAS